MKEGTKGEMATEDEDDSINPHERAASRDFRNMAWLILLCIFL